MVINVSLYDNTHDECEEEHDETLQQDDEEYEGQLEPGDEDHVAGRGEAEAGEEGVAELTRPVHQQLRVGVTVHRVT